MTFIKNQMHPSSNARLFIDSNYQKWHRLYGKSNRNKSTEQLELKSRLKMEGVVCSRRPESHSQMLRRWGHGQVQPAKTTSQKPLKVEHEVIFSFPCSSQLPAVAQLGFDDEQTPFEVLELFLESHPLMNSPHLSSQLFSEAPHPHRHFVFSLWGRFTLLLFQRNRQPEPPALVLCSCCARNTRFDAASNRLLLRKTPALLSSV